MTINSFKDLHVCQKSMELIPRVYDLTAQFPATEKYALSDQMKRAAVSIASNIAEGSRRSTRVDFRQFCRIAQGSSAELETQILAAKLVYPSINIEPVTHLLGDVQRMLTMLIRSLSTVSTHDKRSTTN